MVSKIGGPITISQNPTPPTPPTTPINTNIPTPSARNIPDLH
jgi:hypothetical protein